MKEFKCPNPAESIYAEKWLPFAEQVTVQFSDVPFPMKGIHSMDSVMVVPFREIDGKYHIGILKEKRPLFQSGWLAAFPAGKIEDKQSAEEAARLESMQEAGLDLKSLRSIGSDMPFLHIIDETVYLFVASVEKKTKQNLEVGELIAEDIEWIEWNEFCSRIRKQQIEGIPLLENTPMLGVSLASANKLLALEFNPEHVF